MEKGYGRLKELRMEKGYPRSYLAKKTFCHLSTYTKYENGERLPPIDILILLAKMYDCSLEYLTGISDIRRPFGD